MSMAKLSARTGGACVLCAIVINLPDASASAQSAYDGGYAGVMTIAQDRAANQTAVFGNRGAVRGESNGRLAPCAAGPYKKTLTITNGQFSFIYSRELQVILNGSVTGDGAVSAFAPSATGGVTLAARITGNDLIGTVGGAYCTYSLQLRRSA
jgi:hypothetical protein